LPSDYVTNLEKDAMLLKDYVLNKKVVDLDEHEISMVYDVKIIQIGKKLYASDVDFSRYGFFKRLHLKRIANLFHVTEDLLSWIYVLPLPDNIDSFKGNVQLKTVKDNLANIAPVDMADILEELSREQRTVVFSELSMEHASETLEEIDPNVQREIVSTLDKNTVARLINDMTPGQAADILSVIPYEDKSEIIKLLNPDLVDNINSIIENQEENVLNFITTSFLSFSPDELVKDVIKKFKELSKDKNMTHYLYVTDESEKLLGILDVRELIIADENCMLKDIMKKHVVSINCKQTLEEASQDFLRYGFHALPIVDDDDKIIGVIPYRDVMNLKHRF
jgi:Mg/Co/Ni transporter MgtE